MSYMETKDIFFGSEIQELDVEEIDLVDGAGFWSDLGYAIGKIWGMGTNMQTSIDETGSPMLQGMAMGA